jgi:hypothetical protein
MQGLLCVLIWLVPAAFCFGSNPFYYKHWCGTGDRGTPMIYAYDTKCVKLFPSVFERDWTPPAGAGPVPDGYFPDAPLYSVLVDDRTLLQLDIGNLARVDLALILVQRNESGKAFFKYFGNGRENIPEQTWSSSKLFGVAAAGGKLECACKTCLDAHATGKHGATPLGDLITVIPTYDITAGYSSNSNAKYFASIANHSFLSHLISGPWLGRGNESLGGSYGEPVPPDLSYSFDGCRILPDNPLHIDGDFLSMLSNAELFRRIVMHRDVAQDRRFPDLSWESVTDILYGAKKSLLFPGTQWGGLAAGFDIFVQSGVPNMTEVDSATKGRWRIFSKIGDGISDTSGQGQMIVNSYASLGPNVEFIISIRASQSASSGVDPVVVAQNMLQPIIAKIVTLIISGALK